MATVIDSLLIELGLDSSKFMADQKKVIDALKEIQAENEKLSKSGNDLTEKTTAVNKKSADQDKKTHTEKKKAAVEDKKAGEESSKRAKESHLDSKKTADGYDKAKSSVLGLATAYFGLAGMKALVNMTDKVAQESAERSRQSTLLGVSPKQIQAMGAVAQVVGATEEDITSSLQSIQTAFTAFATGGQSQGAQIALDYLKINREEIDNLPAVSAKVKKYIEDVKEFDNLTDTQATQRALKYTLDIGYTEATFKMLMLGPEKLQELTNEYEELGHVTPELTAESQKSAEATAKLSAAWNGLTNVVSEGMLPAFTLLKTVLADVVGSMANVYAGYHKFMHGVDVTIIDKLKSTVEYLNKNNFNNTLPTSWVNKLEESFIPERFDKEKSAAGPMTNSASADFSDIEKANGLPLGILKKVRARESRGKDSAVSRSAEGKVLAEGPFGIRPSTGAMLGLHDREAFDVGRSSNAAGKYLGDLLKKYHDMDKALAAYNWGPTNVDKKGMGNLPEETRGYIAEINPHSYTGSSATSPMANNSRSQSTEVNVGTMNIQSNSANPREVANAIPFAISSFYDSTGTQQ